MKTKFYKRLVPIALIASMAVTNVGLTSMNVSAEKAAVVQTTGNAPVVKGDNTEAGVIIAEDEAPYASFANDDIYFNANPTTSENQNANALNYVMSGALNLYKNKGSGSVAFTAAEAEKFYFTNTAGTTKYTFLKVQNYNAETKRADIAVDVKAFMEAVGCTNNTYTNVSKQLDVKLYYPLDDGEGNITATNLGMSSPRLYLNGTPVEMDLKENVTSFVKEESIGNNVTGPLSYVVYDSEGNEVNDFEITDNYDSETTRVTQITVSLKEDSNLKTTAIAPGEEKFFYAYRYKGTGLKTIVASFYVVNDIADQLAIVTPTAVGTGDKAGFAVPATKDFNLSIGETGIKNGKDQVVVALNSSITADTATGLKLPQKDAKAGTKDDLTTEEKNTLKTLAQTEKAAYETTYKNTEAAKDTDVVKAASALYVQYIIEQKGTDMIESSSTKKINGEDADRVWLKNKGLATNEPDWALLTGSTLTTGIADLSQSDMTALITAYGTDAGLTNAKKTELTTAAEANTDTSKVLETAYKTAFETAFAAVTTTGDTYQNALKAYVGTEANFYTDATDTSSPVYTKAQELMAGHTVQAGVDADAIKWVVEEEVVKNGKTSYKASGKAKVNGAAFKKGESVTINKTSATGKYNSTVLVKAVGKDYETKKVGSTGYKLELTKDATTGKVTKDTRVFAEFKLYLTPAVAESFKDGSASAAKLSKKGVSFTGNNDDGYVLSIPEGQSVKLPFVIDGKPADKTVNYKIGEGSTGFQCVNGVVKALAHGGLGTIECYAASNPEVKIDVTVKTTSALKSVRANINKVSVYPGSVQTVSLGTTPASFDSTFSIGGNTSGDVSGIDNVTYSISNNILTIDASAATAADLDKKKATLEVVGKDAAGTAIGKPYKITLSGMTTPMNAKNYKLTTKKVNADGFIEVNVPVGSSYNLGVAMNPATADAGFVWAYANVQPASDATLSGNLEALGEKTVPEQVIDGAAVPANDAAFTSTAFGTITAKTDETGTEEENATRKKYGTATYALINAADPTEIINATVSGNTVTVAAGGITDANIGKTYKLAQKYSLEKYSNSAWAAVEDSDAWEIINGDKTVTIGGTIPSSSVPKLQVSGDVLKGNAKGVYYMQATSVAKGADNATLKTPIYKINVYEPGSTVVMNAMPVSGAPSGAEEYAVVGGILMSKTEADTTCSKELLGGQSYTFPVPTTAGSVHEDIEWKCNKPAGVAIDTTTNDGYMTITPLQTGKFTITGVTKYTKQKITFRVNAVANDTAIGSAAAGDYTIQYKQANGTWANLAGASLNIKDKVDIRAISSREGAVGTIKFTTTAADKAAVSASGQINAKAAGTGKAGATVTFKKSDKSTKDVTIPEVSFTVVEQAPVFTKLTVPSGFTLGGKGKLTAAVKNVKVADATVQWQYKAATGDWTNISGATTVNANLSAATLPTGKLKIRCVVNDVASDEKEMMVYATAQAIKSASTNYTFKAEDITADATIYDAAEIEVLDEADEKKGEANKKKNLANVNKAYKNTFSNLKGKKTGQGAGYGIYYIPIFASPSTSGTTLTAATADDIEWTSDNVNLAIAETIAYNASNTGLEGALVDKAAAKSAYAIAKITTSGAQASGYTGQVKLTGTLKNSGKKVVITLNVNGGADNSNTATTPEITFTTGSETSIGAFDATDRPADTYSDLADNTAVSENNAKKVRNTKAVLVATNNNPTSCLDVVSTTDGKTYTVASDKIASLSNNTVYYKAWKVTYVVGDGTSTWSSLSDQTEYVVIADSAFKAVIASE